MALVALASLTLIFKKDEVLMCSEISLEMEMRESLKEFCPIE